MLSVGICVECDEPAIRMKNNRCYCAECYEQEFSCLNCGELLKENEGHYVPPSLGDKGFFACEKK